MNLPQYTSNYAVPDFRKDDSCRFPLNTLNHYLLSSKKFCFSPLTGDRARVRGAGNREDASTKRKRRRRERTGEKKYETVLCPLNFFCVHS